MLILILGDIMLNDNKTSDLFELKEKMDLYKRKLTDKYVRANTKSKLDAIVFELYEFSEIYRNLYGNEVKFEWDNDVKMLEILDKKESIELNNFVDNINNSNDFYLKLSDNVIENFKNSKYPFYKYLNGHILFAPRMNINTMMDNIFEFFKKFDYSTYLELNKKIYNLELLDFNLNDSYGGKLCHFPSIKKSLILLNDIYEYNVFKFETFVHEYGHAFEIQMYLDSNNNYLANKAFETPFSEVVSSFFEYSFLNYLKENKIYPSFVNQCFDNFFKELIYNFYNINLLSKDLELEIDEYGLISLDNERLITCGDEIKRKLNYYELQDHKEKVNYRNPYIYGIGSLFSIYLYENYKENPNFLSEFKKTLLSYPLTNDLSSFENLGINSEKLLKNNNLEKILIRHSNDF